MPTPRFLINEIKNSICILTIPIISVDKIKEIVAENCCSTHDDTMIEIYDDNVSCLLNTKQDFILHLHTPWSVYSKLATQELVKIHGYIPIYRYTYINWYPYSNVLREWISYFKNKYPEMINEYITSMGKYRAELLFVKNREIK